MVTGMRFPCKKSYESEVYIPDFRPECFAAPSRLGDMLAQRKIDDARRLTPEQRRLIALELSAAAALHRAGSAKR